MNCEHDKVYSGGRSWTLVPKWEWICARCKATGQDSMREAPPLDFDRFTSLLDAVDPVGAEGMRRLRERMKR